MRSRAVGASYAAFGLTGFAAASWASEIPRVRDHLSLSPAELGLVLLFIAGGSVVALPLAGPFVTRFGSRRVVQVMAVVNGAAVVAVGAGYPLGPVPVACTLFVFGFTHATWDVAMNVQGAVVERQQGRPLMPRFHAGFSLGTVGGALIGAAVVAVGLSVAVHLAVAGVLVGVVAPLAVRGFVADLRAGSTPRGLGAARRGVLQAWREPRTLLVGLFVAGFALAEGSGNDWASVAMIDGYGVSRVVGTLAFAAFLAAVTVGRWIGPMLLERHGRVVVVRSAAVVCLVGLLLFVLGGQVLGGHVAVAFVGVVLWGAGLALGFPVGMSAGADDPARAASRVGVIASIGYLGFLVGPPLIGFLAERVGVLHALTAVGVLLVVGIVIAGNVAEPDTDLPGSGAEPHAGADQAALARSAATGAR